MQRSCSSCGRLHRCIERRKLSGVRPEEVHDGALHRGESLLLAAGARHARQQLVAHLQVGGTWSSRLARWLAFHRCCSKVMLAYDFFQALRALQGLAVVNPKPCDLQRPQQAVPLTV